MYKSEVYSVSFLVANDILNYYYLSDIYNDGVLGGHFYPNVFTHNLQKNLLKYNMSELKIIPLLKYISALSTLVFYKGLREIFIS